MEPTSSNRAAKWAEALLLRVPTLLDLLLAVGLIALSLVSLVSGRARSTLGVLVLLTIGVVLGGACYAWERLGTEPPLLSPRREAWRCALLALSVVPGALVLGGVLDTQRLARLALVPWSLSVPATAWAVHALSVFALRRARARDALDG